MVERNLAKVEVAGSSPVIRSRQNEKGEHKTLPFSFLKVAERGAKEAVLNDSLNGCQIRR